MEVFTPKTTPEFETLRWLANAVSNDPLQPGWQCLNVRKGLIVATDGPRLHQYNGHITGLFPGTHRVHKRLQKEIQLELVELDSPYPDTDSAWPDTGELTEVPLVTSYWKTDADLSFARVIRAMTTDVALDHRLFTDAIRGAEFTAYVGEGISPIVLLNGERQAIVMPIRANS